MANAEQLEILKQGVEVWNTWREENPHVPIDLAGAELMGVHLEKANLSHAAWMVRTFPMPTWKTRISS